MRRWGGVYGAGAVGTGLVSSARCNQGPHLSCTWDVRAAMLQAEQDHRLCVHAADLREDQQPHIRHAGRGGGHRGQGGRQQPAGMSWQRHPFVLHVCIMAGCPSWA